MAAKDLRINEQIRVREVRVIDNEGKQRGVMSTPKALELAQESGSDLVEVAPQGNPPVCKVLDYGKYKFEQEKKRKEAKKKQTQVKLKEIRMQPKIEKHDLDFKTDHVKSFLEEGNKVKVTIRFRGREMAHTEIGRQVLEQILVKLDELDAKYNVDRKPQMEGRFMSMILSPKSIKK